MVNGLLKTAQGVPPGTVTTLLSPQEATVKLAATKCLVAILRSMGDWMNMQLRIPDPHLTKNYETVENTSEAGTLPMADVNGEETVEGSDSQSETSGEVSDLSAIEQQHAYKLELQVYPFLIVSKPKKGIECLINANKVGNTLEDIAKNASGLNKTLIDDYLGEREDLSLKVMHAYVDSFDFQEMDFDEAIRSFLRGFKLPELSDRPVSYAEAEVEFHLVSLCQEVLQFYIETANSRQPSELVAEPGISTRGVERHIPLGSGKRRELAAWVPLVVTTLHAIRISSLGNTSFEKYLARFFPLLSNLISCEHGLDEVQLALSDMLSSSVGPVLLRSCEYRLLD